MTAQNNNDDNTDNKSVDNQNANAGSDGSGNGEGNKDTKGGNSQNNQSTDDNGANNGGGERTFTQAEVNKMMTREKKQGRNAAFNELGINPEDTKMINAFKAFKDAYEGNEGGSDGAADNSAVEDAERRAMMAEMKYEAVAAGVQPQFVDDVVTLAIARIDEETDIKTVIGEFRTKYPAWFEESDDGGKQKNIGQTGTGSSLKNNGEGNSGDGGKQKPGLGARLAAQRKGSNAKKSYWS